MLPAARRSGGCCQLPRRQEDAGSDQQDEDWGEAGSPLIGCIAEVGVAQTLLTILEKVKENLKYFSYFCYSILRYIDKRVCGYVLVCSVR